MTILLHPAGYARLPVLQVFLFGEEWRLPYRPGIVCPANGSER